MVNKARLTKKFCILGAVVEDLAKINAWIRQPALGFNLVAVVGNGGTYEARVVTKGGLAILDLVLEVGFEVKVLTSTTVAAFAAEAA